MSEIQIGIIIVGSASFISVFMWNRYCFWKDYKDRDTNKKTIDALRQELEAALDRCYDMYLNDDGQAWKEAEKFLHRHGRI